MSDQATIIGNIEEKLSDLPNDFSGIPIDLDKCLKDALRDMGIKNIADVEDNSREELYVEIRATYYAIQRVRNKVALNFKFSTGNDGKSIDKTDQFKAVDIILKDLKAEFKEWKDGYGKSQGLSQTWNRTSTVGSTKLGDL